MELSRAAGGRAAGTATPRLGIYPRERNCSYQNLYVTV